jgi:hypothetical protein
MNRHTWLPGRPWKVGDRIRMKKMYKSIVPHLVQGTVVEVFDDCVSVDWDGRFYSGEYPAETLRRPKKRFLEFDS